MLAGEGREQGVTKRCRPSWLTNSALAYEPKCGGEGGSCGVMTEYSCTHAGAQINFGDLTPYLTYGREGEGEEPNHTSARKPGPL